MVLTYILGKTYFRIKDPTQEYLYNIRVDEDMKPQYVILSMKQKADTLQNKNKNDRFNHRYF